MTDPIGVRNVLTQTPVVEKVQQVQQQQGDQHQRFMAHPNPDEVERKTREVQTSDESAESRLRREKGQGEKREAGGRRKGVVYAPVNAPDKEGGKEEAEYDPAEYEPDGTGVIIDIKV